MQTVAETGGMPVERYDEKFERVDERFDDVDREFKRMGERFDEVNRRIGEGRQEAKERFDRVEGDIRQLREIGIPELKGELKGEIREVKEEIREVRAGLAAIQDSFNRLVLGAATSWVILMVTILAKG